MSDSDDEYDPSATKVVEKAPPPPPPTSSQQNLTNNQQPTEKRVFGLRSATGVTTSILSTTANSSTTTAATNTNSSSTSTSSSTTNTNQQLLPLINHFIKSKNMLPIFGEDEFSSASAKSATSSTAAFTKGFPYRVQRAGGSIRCVAASGSVLLAGTSIGTTGASSSTSCPLFAWDIREIARGTAISSGANNNAFSSLNKTTEGLEFRQQGRFLFRTDLFERDRGGVKQQFPAAHLAFVPSSSSSSSSGSYFHYNSLSFNNNNASPSNYGAFHNIFAASAAGSSNFKIAKIDKAGESFGETPSGQAGSLNPETFRGHCGNILSLRAHYNSVSNRSEIVTGGADGTVRLWTLENLNEKNDYCARHGGIASEGMSFSRSARVIGGAVSSSPNLIWSAGLEDGYVMFWDTRQKFKAGFPAMFIKPPSPTAGPEIRIANCLEVPCGSSSSSSSSIFAVRSLDSLRVHDLRFNSTTSNNNNNSNSLMIPEVKDLRLASPSDAAPMILSNDFEASSKNIITTFDSANETEDFFRDGIAVVSLTSGKVVHRGTLFHNTSSSSSSSAATVAPPLIHDMFGIGGSTTGYVGLACSDGMIRFAPVTASAVEKQKKLLMASGGMANSNINTWFENVPMNTITTANSSSDFGRRQRQNDGVIELDD